MRVPALLLALAAPLLLGQAKPILVPDVSQREIEITALILRGHSNAAIA